MHDTDEWITFSAKRIYDQMLDGKERERVAATMGLADVVVRLSEELAELTVAVRQQRPHDHHVEHVTHAGTYVPHCSCGWGPGDPQATRERAVEAINRHLAVYRRPATS